VVLGLAVLLLAGVIAAVKFPASLDAADEGEEPQQGSFGRLFANPHLMFAVVAQFFYVGAQIATWSTLIPYIRAYTHATERASGYLLTSTLVALAVGRIVSTSLMRYIRPERMITIYAIVNIVLLAAGILHPGLAGAYAIVATSFFMSIMYPTIFALGVKDLGSDTKLGGSLIVMAIIGGAIFPPLMGWITRQTGSVALGYLLPAIGYVVVALYGFLAPRLVHREFDVT
jgi:FHS family L-fucose permease-like MFS transporter